MWAERALGPVPEKQRASLARASGIACRSGRNAHRRRRGMRATGQLARRGARSSHKRTPPSPKKPGNSIGPFPHAARGPLEAKTRAAPLSGRRQNVREPIYTNFARPPWLARGGNARRASQRRALRDPGARSGRFRTPGGSLAHSTSVQMWAERALGPVPEKQRAGLARASEFACRSGRNAHRRRPAMRASGRLARSSARPSHERTPPSPRTPGSSLEPFLHARPEPARGGNGRRPPAGTGGKEPGDRPNWICPPPGDRSI